MTSSPGAVTERRHALVFHNRYVATPGTRYPTVADITAAAVADRYLVLDSVILGPQWPDAFLHLLKVVPRHADAVWVPSFDCIEDPDDLERLRRYCDVIAADTGEKLHRLEKDSRS